MQSFFNDLGRGLSLLKAHPDFIAIALLALMLGVARNPGIASAISLRAALDRPPAIEHFVPDVPARFDVRAFKAFKRPPRCEPNVVVLPSY